MKAYSIGFLKHIEVMGIQTYLYRLTKMLGKIGTHEYAEIEKNYIEELWRLFLAVENSRSEELYENIEEEFYILIEKADSEYRNLGEELSERLINYATINYLYGDNRDSGKIAVLTQPP